MTLKSDIRSSVQVCVAWCGVFKIDSMHICVEHTCVRTRERWWRPSPVLYPHWWYNSCTCCTYHWWVQNLHRKTKTKRDNVLEVEDYKIYTPICHIKMHYLFICVATGNIHSVKTFDSFGILRTWMHRGGFHTRCKLTSPCQLNLKFPPDEGKYLPSLMFSLTWFFPEQITPCIKGAGSRSTIFTLRNSWSMNCEICKYHRPSATPINTARTMLNFFYQNGGNPEHWFSTLRCFFYRRKKHKEIRPTRVIQMRSL